MSAQGLLPRRVYRGALGAKRRYFAHKLPLALGAERATFVFVQAEDATASTVRTWGKQDAGLWAALAATGRAVEVVVVGRDPDRLRKAGRVVDAWTKVWEWQAEKGPPFLSCGGRRDERYCRGTSCVARDAWLRVATLSR